MKETFILAHGFRGLVNHGWEGMVELSKSCHGGQVEERRERERE
jgi:hypothetical protein